MSLMPGGVKLRQECGIICSSGRGDVYGDWGEAAGGSCGCGADAGEGGGDDRRQPADDFQLGKWK